jgi:peptidyl-prolyl cis-trans isomerase D
MLFFYNVSIGVAHIIRMLYMSSNKISDFSAAAQNSKKNGEKKPKREIKLSWVLSIILLVLIVVAFGLSPLVGVFGSNRNEVIFGSYDGIPIAYTYNSYMYNQQNTIARNWETESADSSYEYQIYQIWKQAYDSTVIHTALMSEAEKSGMFVTDEAVDRYLLTSGPYVVDGRFDRELYNSVSVENRTAIREDAEITLLQQQLVDDLFGVNTVPAEIDFIAEMSSLEKAYEYILFPMNSYPEEQVITYGQENSDEFVSADISIITFPSGSRNEAQEVYNSIQEGSLLFEEAARAHSVDSFAEDGGEAGSYYYYELRQNFNSTEDLDMLFSLQPGEYTQLIETPFGLNIFKLNSTPDKPDFSNPQLIDTVRNYLISRERGRVEDYLVTEATELAEAGADSFQDEAEQRGLTVYKAGPAPINYGSVQFISSFSYNDDQQIFASLETNEQALRRLFATEEGSLSEPIITESGIVLAYCTEESVTENNRDILDTLYPYYAPAMIQNDFNQMVFSSDKFEDNFIETFFSQVISNN